MFLHPFGLYCSACFGSLFVSEYQYTFLIISHSVLRMKDVSEKKSRENPNTYFVFSNFFEYHAIYEITWKNTAERGKPQTKLWCMLTAFWIPKARNTHTSCVIISAFHCNNGCTNALQCCFLRPLPLFFPVNKLHFFPSMNESTKYEFI
jgi:hypothetical protein